MQVKLSIAFPSSPSVGTEHLTREIQRHAIVITYMFMTNDRYEDSFV